VLGLVLIVGMTFSVRTSPGSNSGPVSNWIFFLAPPLLCGIAGFRSSWRNGTFQAGLYAGTLTGVIGMLILTVSQPLIIALFWSTIRGFYPVPQTQSMWISPGIWSDQLDGGPGILLTFLFMGICAGAIGSGVGRGLALAPALRES
jgi:hypothetical protein